MYNWIGQDEDSTYDTSIPGAHTDYISIAGGFQFEVIENCLLNLGVCHTYFDHKYNNEDEMGGFAEILSPGATQRYNKQYIVIALGVQYKF